MNSFANTARLIGKSTPLRVPLQAQHTLAVMKANLDLRRPDTAEGLSTGLIDILRRGLVFVRLDQVDLVEVKDTPPH